MERNGENSSLESRIRNEKYDVTEIIVKEFSYTWEIKNFQHVHRRTGEYISSPDFQAGTTDENRWCLWLFPNGYNQNSLDYLSIRLYWLKGEAAEKNIVVEFFLLNADENKNFLHKILLDNINSPDQRIVSKFIKKDSVFDENNGFLTDNKLTIKCKMYFNENIVNYSLPAKKVTSKIHLKTFNDFECLLENGKFSDIKLLIEDQEIYAHKNILAARSKVFSAMFEHNMKEQLENAVEITDIDHKVMKEVLRFMYSGKVNNIQILKNDLLAAADKYEIDELKALCEEELIVSLDINNLGETMILADRYQMDNLRTVVVEFFRECAQNLANTESFEVILKSLSPYMLVEIIKSSMLKK